MHKQSAVRLGVIAAALCFVAVQCRAEKTKASFESGDFAGWDTQGKGWSVYDKDGSDGEKSAMCVVEKGEAPGLKALARKINNADVGWLIKVSFDIAGKAKDKSSKATVAVMFLDKEGRVIREVKKMVTEPNAKFQKFSLPETIVPSGTAETYLMLVVETVKPATAKEWWRFDNIGIGVS